jgi:phenylacetate-CoA ligase
MNQDHYDALETRSAAARADDLAGILPRLVAHAKAACPAQRDRLAAVDPQAIRTPADLRQLPVLRKQELMAQQEALRATDPFAGYAACGWTGVPAPRRAKRVFQSPGRIYEPQGEGPDALRAARALFAAGIRPGELVHNSFSYHLTPAGAMMEDAAFALGCTVFPGGVGNSELQVAAMLDLRPQAYVGTPGFLKILIEAAAAQGRTLPVRKALFSGEAYPPSLHRWMQQHGVDGYQCYASADLGLIAYETAARQGLVVAEGVLVEILAPGTGEPVADGEIGEVVVTALGEDYPLLRFATGDLSAVLPGTCPTGRTHTRIRGWLGRADQATKVRGMFVHPTQVAELVRRHPQLQRARLVVEGEVGAERLALHAEAQQASPELQAAVVASIRELTRLRAEVLLMPPGGLADGGKAIDDRRSYR